MDKSKASIELMGLHLVGAPPVGHLQLKLEPGLTAFYGKNGAGKTRILATIQHALNSLPLDSEIRVDDYGNQFLVRDSPLDLPRALETLYYHSGFHFRSPVTSGSWGDVKKEIADAATRAGYATEGVGAFGDTVAAATWKDLVLFVMSRLPFDATVDDAEYLLSNGRWIVSATSDAPLTLCDPDPYLGPLQEHWRTSASVWEASAVAWTKRSDSGPLLRYDANPHEGRTGWQCEIDWQPDFYDDPLPGLPPLPGLLRLDGFPDWFAFPVASMSRSPISALFGQTIEEQATRDVVADTISMLPYRRDATSMRSDQFPLAGASTTDVLQEICSRANRMLAAFFDEPPLLHAELRDVGAWMKGRPAVIWAASTGSQVQRFPIGDLGQAHRRYATFAIQRALATVDRDGARLRVSPPDSQVPSQGGATIALIDEPEAALNPSAEHQVASGLSRLADFVLVATHSPIVVDNATRVTHVTQSESGLVHLAPLMVDLDPANRQLEARRLGHTPGSLALLVRVVLLVEGPMDESVISAYLKRELGEAATTMLPLMGTKNVVALPNAAYLFNSTRAPVVVCLDNIDSQFITDVRAHLERTRDDASRRQVCARASADAAVRKSPEMKTLVELLSAACAAHRLDRIHIFGFKKRDIVEYLPVDLFRPGATSWGELWDEFSNTLGRRPAAGDGSAFKRYVGNYTVKGVNHALDRIRLEHPGVDGLEKQRPIEFTQLAQLILELSKR